MVFTIAGRTFSNFDLADQQLVSEYDYEGTVIEDETITLGLTGQEVHVLFEHHEGLTREAANAIKEYLFNRFDADSNGVISLDEWNDIGSSISMNTLSLLVEYDTDFNGEVSYDELRADGKLTDRQAQNVFRALNIDYDVPIGQDDVSKIVEHAPIIIVGGQVHKVADQEEMTLASLILFMQQAPSNLPEETIDDLLSTAGVNAEPVKEMIKSLRDSLSTVGSVSLDANQANFLLEALDLQNSIITDYDIDVISGLQSIAQGDAMPFEITSEQLMRSLVTLIEDTTNPILASDITSVPNGGTPRGGGPNDDDGAGGPTDGDNGDVPPTGGDNGDVPPTGGFVGPRGRNN